MRLELVLFVILVATSNGLEITCNFHEEYWENMGNVYTCSVLNLIVRSPDMKVTKVIGDHLKGKSDIDVVKLNIQDQICSFLPKGFENFFPNLEGIRVATCGLIELRQSDISVFQKLRNCDMFHNYIEVLDRNLFVKNPNLEYLYFGDNRIRSVGYNMLKPLKKIHKVIFQGNYCIHQNADSVNEVPVLQRSLNEKCSTYTEADARWMEEQEERLENEGKVSNFSLWLIVISIISVIAIAAWVIVKRRRENKFNDTESVANFLPYNEMNREPIAPYENGSTDLTNNNNHQWINPPNN